MAAELRVQVAVSMPGDCQVSTLTLPAGAKVRDALAAAGLLADDETLLLGIYGRRVTLDEPLADEDRVELYRALLVDPKQARRERARKTRK